MMTHGSPACREALELLVRLYEILVRLAPPVKDRTVFCSAQHLCLCVCGGWGWMGLFLSTYIQSTPRYTQVHIHTQYKVYKHTCTRTRARAHTHTPLGVAILGSAGIASTAVKRFPASHSPVYVCISVFSLSLTIEEMRCHAIDMAKCLHAWTDRQQTTARRHARSIVHLGNGLHANLRLLCLVMLAHGALVCFDIHAHKQT